MSNYTKLVDFAVKDALSPGNADKKILGTQLGAEFDAIATAIATKSDTSTVTASLLGKAQIVSSVSGTNTITGTVTGYASYTNGDSFILTPANSVTGAATLNLTSLGAKAIVNRGLSALVGGELIGNATYLLVYNSSINSFVIQNPHPSQGTFTGTFTGMASATTGTIYYSKDGLSVSIYSGTISGTSNATNMSLTGIPSNIAPLISSAIGLTQDLGPVIMGDNNSTLLCNAYASSSSSIRFDPMKLNGAGTGLTTIGNFTTSGLKGCLNGFRLTYMAAALS